MTTSCDHPGRSTDLDHAATCTDCGDALRALRRVERALATVHADRRPPPGWQTRVLAAAATPPRRAWSWSWLRLGLTAAPLGVAATIAVAILATRAPTAAPAVGLEVSVKAHPGLRGSGAPLGLLTARGDGGPAARALWIYRGATRIQRCPGELGCSDRGGALTARFDAASTGRYTILYVAGATAPTSTGSLDADLAAAVATGAEIVVKTVDVR